MRGTALPRTGTLPLPLEEQESTGPLGRPRPRGNTPGRRGQGTGTLAVNRHGQVFLLRHL